MQILSIHYKKNFKLFIFFLFIALAACGKKQIKENKLLENRHIHPTLSQFIPMQRVGIGSLTETLVLNILKIDAVLQLEQEEPYLFELTLAETVLYSGILEKDDFDIWFIPNTNSSEEIKIPFDFSVYKDGSYPLILKIKKTKSADEIYQSSLNLAVEFYTLRNQTDLQNIEKFDLKGNYVLGNDIELTGNFTPIALCSFPILD